MSRFRGPAAWLPGLWRRTAHALSRLGAALLLLGCAHGALGAEVTIGVFAWQGERATVSDWSPLIDYLDKALPGHHFRLRDFDAAGLRQAIASHEIDLVVTNPGYYVSMEAEFGISRIATLASARVPSPSRALGSVVFTLARRAELRRLTDLAGRRVAAVAPDAFGGYLVAAGEFQHQGIDARGDFRELRFVGLPMLAVIEAVRAGEVDAGIVRTCFLEQLVEQEVVKPGEFSVIGARSEPDFPCATSTRLYPDWPIAVTRQTDPHLAKQVARALLDMPERPLAWAVPADYRPVHDLFQELHVGPYAELHSLEPGELVRRFWPWLLGLVAVLLAGVVHSVRVEYQVHRRTRQLRESLQAREVAEARMRESQEQMEHLSRLSVLGELSGSLAHEINQPLTTIGNYARTVLRRQAGNSLSAEAVAQACTEIVSEAERAGGIVQRIRHFARKRPAVREHLDLAALAEDARRLVLGMLASPPEIVISDHSRPGCEVTGDGQQIQQVLLNLVKNAVDAERGLPPQRQRIEVAIERADHRVVVRVADRGAGVAEPDRARLFEPFFTTKRDGVGLGLSICKTIIEAHGGRLWAEPNPDGCGMRFSFSLPCHELQA